MFSSFFSTLFCKQDCGCRDTQNIAWLRSQRTQRSLCRTCRSSYRAILFSNGPWRIPGRSYSGLYDFKIFYIQPSISYSTTVRHLPLWFPGASFRRLANEWKMTLVQMVNQPYDLVKQQVVPLYAPLLVRFGI